MNECRTMLITSGCAVGRVEQLVELVDDHLGEVARARRRGR